MRLSQGIIMRSYMFCVHMFETSVKWLVKLLNYVKNTLSMQGR